MMDILAPFLFCMIEIKGNHDREKHLEYYRSLGWRIIDSIEVEVASMSNKEKVGLKNLQAKIANSKEHKLTAALVMELNGQRVLFSHFPVFDNNPYDEKYKTTTEVLEELYILFDCKLNIHGHSPYKEPKFYLNYIGIDTGCVYGRYEKDGYLTAIEWPSKKIIQKKYIG